MSAVFPSPLAAVNAPDRGSDASAATAVINDSELQHDLLFPLPDPPISLNNGQADSDDDSDSGVNSHCAPKRRKRGGLGSTVCYPEPMGIRFDPRRMGGRYATIVSHDLVREESQEA